MSRTDEELVRDALDHIERIATHLASGIENETVIADAVNMRLSAAIESISKTSEQLRDMYFADDWHLIRAVRNRIALAEFGEG